MTLVYAILGVILALFSAFAAGHRKGKASAQEADRKESERVLNKKEMILIVVLVLPMLLTSA
ncbi:hypothetical protein [Liberibacter crescens]|uniref:hypothetical protein n=1 Tax=Liberibacter crescens TaxID=1273132 RepID=UPI00059F8001|nr:hypothetical protein [Liberibacter crescens]AMC12919.1 hypothetical protein RL73_04490 [Liberibacter crescens]